MYIRRKVFSVLADEMGEERLYSVNETLFEGYEYDELDERMFASVINGKVGSTDVKNKKEMLDFIKKYAGKDGELADKVKVGENLEKNRGVIIDKRTGKPIEVIKGASKSEQAAIKRAQKKGLKAYEKALKEQKIAFDKSGVASMKKVLRAQAEAAGRKSATLKDVFKNSSKLGKAGMIAAPVALVGGAALAGRASKKD